MAVSEGGGCAAPAPPGAVAWLFLSPEAVPSEWQARAVPLSMVPLLPSEAASVLLTGGTAPELRGEEDLLRLVAQGLTRESIARRLGISVRTVQRRIARIQDYVGVSSATELVVEVARRGF
jgi:DNA-binding CsgD family transcriptional regulator